MSGVEEEIHDFDESEMTMTMEEVVTPLQQEVFTLKAQVADQSGRADAVRPSTICDTPSRIDVKGLGRPKEFSGKIDDLQQWSKKTEAFFAGVIKESEMMLEWSAAQATEIRTSAIHLEFLPNVTNVERRIQNLECVARDA